MSIEIRHVRKTYGRFSALTDVSLSVPEGELIALLGPSGSGKTTLLRIIAGLEMPDPGPASEVRIQGVDISKQSVRDRRIGFVFQHYALFRHMTVFENIAFGLRAMPRKQRSSREVIRTRVEELLELVQLGKWASHYPSQLSGGQRQRVALARVLAIQPRVMLLDEPFGALDARIRRELRQWLRDLHRRVGLTTVLVTHDHEEALEVADRIVVMHDAKIEQVAPPDEILAFPASTFVREFFSTTRQPTLTRAEPA
jgi:sulfate/thiosulfate transport system ATP-binding protein